MYAILRKFRLSPPTEYRVLTSLPPDLDEFSKQPIAFDFECHGLDPTSGTIRSVAISNDYGTVAIDLEALTAPDRQYLSQWLAKQKLIAHNAVFDAAWIYAKMGIMPQIEACTLILFKLLATEGYLGQTWGLKSAMKDILGWEESNEADLYEWLKANKLKKGDMAQAPWDILGKYNAMDAVSTWQLYKCFRSTIEEHGWESCIWDFHQADIINVVELAIEQQIEGMTIDLAALDAYDIQLAQDMNKLKQDFLTNNEVAPHITAYQRFIIETIQQARPPQFTKAGVTTARFKKWEEKLNEAGQRIDFNIDSPKQLQWLFYERMFYTCPILTDKGVLPSVGAKAIPHLGDPGKVLKKYRKLRDKRKFIASLRDVQRDGVLYPSIKIFSTVTGRSSGGREE